MFLSARIRRPYLSRRLWIPFFTSVRVFTSFIRWWSSLHRLLCSSSCTKHVESKSARSSLTRVLASTLFVLILASAMSRVLEGLERMMSKPYASSLSWIWIHRFPVGSTTAFASSRNVVSFRANSSMPSTVFLNLISSSSVPSSSRTAA